MDVADTLSWDGENLRHLEERNATRVQQGQRPVTRGEVDALYVSGEFTVRHVEYLTQSGEWEWQVHLIGRTPEGRPLTVGCQMADDGRFRPITVWSSSGAERVMYREDRSTDDDG